MSDTLTFENFDRLRLGRLYKSSKELEESIEEMVPGETILARKREANMNAIDANFARAPMEA
jgi:hypothetical protein